MSRVHLSEHADKKVTHMQAKDQTTVAFNLPIIVINAVVDDPISSQVSGERQFHCTRSETKTISDPVEVTANENAMPGLPPIDLGQLKMLLRDPKMPSHKILKEVADTIDSNGRSDGESEAEDQAVPNIFDMIIEASMKVEDEESEEEEEASCHVPHDRCVPCRVCGKEFASSWPLNMHMAVAHRSGDAEQEKSGKQRLGKRSRLSRDADSRDKKIRLSPKIGEIEKKSVEEGSLLMAVRRSVQIKVNRVDVTAAALPTDPSLLSSLSQSCDQRLSSTHSGLASTQPAIVTSPSDSNTPSDCIPSENPKSVKLTPTDITSTEPTAWDDHKTSSHNSA